MVDQVIAIICDLVGADEGEILPDTDLFEQGILDSFALVELLVELEQLGSHLDVANMEREELSTPAKLAALVEAE